MARVLGSGVNQAYIYDRRGETRLLPLPRISTIGWGRSLSQVSTGKVTIEAAQCTPKLDQIHAWAHNLVIFRTDRPGGNGRRVWEGPIQTIDSGNGQLIIDAVDVMGLGIRRANRVARKLAASPARTELLWSVQQMLNPDDPNVLAYLQTVGGVGDPVERDLARYSTYHADDFATLTGAGAAYTVLGRRIILFTDEDTLGRTEDLNPEDHMDADVRVVEDGTTLATFAAARDDNGVSGTYDVGASGVDPYYGRVDQIVSSGPGKATKATLENRARATVRRSYPARQTIVIPDGAKLQCDAPFPIESLVPGTLVPVVTTTATGRTIRATMVLSSVNVSQAPNSDEAVAITLVPLPSEA